MVGYTRRFIKDFAQKAAPLQRLLRKDALWKWGVPQDQAFAGLKEALASAPVLAFPDWSKPFNLSTDGSGAGISATLFQGSIEDGTYRVIAYYSRPLKDYETRYWPWEFECLAVVQGMVRFRPYLEGNKFTLYTDHAALVKCKDVSDPNTRVWRWLYTLQNFDFDVKHRKGEDNAPDDARSRDPVHSDQGPEVEDVAIEDPVVFLFEEVAASADKLSNENIRKEQQADVELSKLIDFLKTGKKPTNVNKNEFYAKADNLVIDGKSGLLVHVHKQRKREDIVLQTVVPKALQWDVWNETHAAGHLQYSTCVQLLERRWFWQGMRADVLQLCRACHICQTGNLNSRSNARGKTSVVHQVPPEPWHTIQVDHSGRIGTSATKRGNSYILGVVDELTGYTIWRPVHDATWKETWRALSEIFADKGCPKVMRSDAGSTFDCAEAREELAKWKIEQRLNPPHHHESTGMVERAMRTMHQMERKAKKAGDEWDELAQFHALQYNNAPCDALDEAPFFLFYGRDARVPGQRPKEQEEGGNPETRMAHRLMQMGEAWQKAVEARQKVVLLQVEKDSRQAHKYNVGDLVATYIDVHAAGEATKHEVKWFGPFSVKEKLAHNEYKIRAIGRGRKILIRHADQLIPYMTVDTPRVQPPARTDIRVRASEADDSAASDKSYTSDSDKNSSADEHNTDGSGGDDARAAEAYQQADRNLEGIVEHKGKGRYVRYRVAFKGEGPEGDLWYREDQLPHAKELVRRYKERYVIPEVDAVRTKRRTASNTKRRAGTAATAATRQGSGGTEGRRGCWIYEDF
eukprot:TRINITY_DN966_c0_g1_i8.p1 TRINITY_DN966_c0_g1~~TRINITY_DN966_c0_g1_i8.p1  ORF type:complete len:802 (+),score=143.47 TRINITY_DN966_c0_g1_i8:939-3344(+)